MQTKRKQKQWVLIALTMIATLTLQLFAPITAHAEEEKTELYSDVFAHTDYKSYSSVVGVDYEYSADHTIVSNQPYKMVLIQGVDLASDSSMGSKYVYFLFDDITNLSLSYYYDHDEIGSTSSGKRSSSTVYSSADLKTLTSESGNTCYYLDVFSFSVYEQPEGVNAYYPHHLKTTVSSYDYCITEDFYNSGNINNETYRKEILSEIVNGTITPNPDISFNELTATYDADLDFASLGAKSNSAWTVSKGDDGYTLTTPSTAGVNIYWKNKQYVENSYVKIYFNGKYYKKFLDIKYVDGAISLSGEGTSSSVEYDKIDRSSNSVFFLYNDILNECIKQNNYDGGYSFVIDNIQLQCYAEIDGIVKKSRIYKIDFNLLRENGTTDTVFNDASNVTYSTTDSVLGDFTTAYDDLEFVADIDVDKPIYEYDEVETNSFIKFFKWFYEMLQGITNSLGQFPQLLTSVFGFLPKEVTIIIGLALGAVVILRFLGR